jgi:hypothetical protein
MRWFRNKIGQGAWLALIALAINLGLSFGHVHTIDGKGFGQAIVASPSSAAVSDESPRRNGPDDGHADYLCPICTASSALASALFVTPPALPLEFNDVTIHRTAEAVIVVIGGSRAGFQSRAPPIS